LSYGSGFRVSVRKLPQGWKPHFYGFSRCRPKMPCSGLGVIWISVPGTEKVPQRVKCAENCVVPDGTHGLVWLFPGLTLRAMLFRPCGLNGRGLRPLSTATTSSFLSHTLTPIPSQCINAGLEALLHLKHIFFMNNPGELRACSYPSSPTLSRARKASCGMSTRPMRFMRFLPSFCFSSSLRFRVMSPP